MVQTRSGNTPRKPTTEKAEPTPKKTSPAKKSGFLKMNTYQTAALVLVAPFALQWLYKRVLTLAALDPTNVGAKLTAGILKSYSFEDDEFFSADGAPSAVIEQRKKGFAELGKKRGSLFLSPLSTSI